MQLSHHECPPDPGPLAPLCLVVPRCLDKSGYLRGERARMVHVVAGTSCGGNMRSALPCAYAGRLATYSSADLRVRVGATFLPSFHRLGPCPSHASTSRGVCMDAASGGEGMGVWREREGVCEGKVFSWQGYRLLLFLYLLRTCEVVEQARALSMLGSAVSARCSPQSCAAPKRRA